MPLYTFDNEQLTKIYSTNFKEEKIYEREVQKVLRDRIDIISPDTLIISEEFGEWNEGARRIDLLGLDRQANLVVIELIRDEIGSHMELQALRYAAMVSTLTFKKAVDIYQKYLDKRNIEKNAEEEIREFLGWGEHIEDQFPTDIRIVLASANFSKELTTTVLWLNERNLDIRCVRLQPYKLKEQVILDIDQIIPLPEAEDYQVKIREQSEERRAAAKASKDKTRYRFMENLYNKRRLVLAVITHYIKENSNITFENLKQIFPDELQGPLGVVALLKDVQNKTERYFLDNILVTSDEKKFVVCHQWGIGNIGNFINKARELDYEIDSQ
ncbi:hypothetical protein STA3757_01930 [Stanieria sp. NIES-3757]|nr:hypothetical protein STA3757_01930 [Stanieria sp. NIES-3757]